MLRRIKQQVAQVLSRAQKTLHKVDESVDTTTELVAALLQEILDGVDIELTIDGKPTKFGVRLLPRGEDDDDSKS